MTTEESGPVELPEIKDEELPILKEEQAFPEYEWLDKLTHIMDSGVKVPGTNFRFGLDPVLGLIPGIGEITTYGISAILVLAMVRHGVSGKVALRMFWNIFAEVTLGAIPIVGDIWDFFFKSNRKNYQLLREHHLEGKHEGSIWWVLIAAFAFLIGGLAITIYGLIKFGGMIWGLIF